MTEPTHTPFDVDGSPVPAQIMAGIRQAGAAISVVLGVLGQTHYASLAGDPKLLTAIGVIGYGIFFIWGQLATRIKAKQLTIAAFHAPAEIANVKGQK